MTDRYLDLIDRTLDAYTEADIARYLDEVRRDGLTEHGFPRLTAAIGILIAHGRRAGLRPLFAAMMDLCAAEMRCRHAGNEFSVREIVMALAELEAAGKVAPTELARWRAGLAALDPDAAYDKIARTSTDRPHNWACFAALSEFVRGKWLGVDTSAFVDLQLETQMRRFDENGMYRDPHEPMVYDLVPRALLSLLRRLGYAGRFAEAIDAHLRRAGLLTLAMQSTTGEIPYGGRSAQFVHNEAILAIVLEAEATAAAQAGQLTLAGQYKYAANLALGEVERGLTRRPLRHVKNDFPIESGYGCEGYAYFDKYMITTASFLYAASCVCDDGIRPTAPSLPPSAQTSPHFHKLVLRAGDYFAELDTAADPHYDASGLGRIHRAGAPSAICLSLPAPASPKYRIDGDPVPLAICPAIGERTAAVYTVEALHGASATLAATVDETPVRMTVTVDETGVTIAAEASGEVALLLPAFAFDGTTRTAITLTDRTLTVAYASALCRTVTDGRLTDTARIARNRNGHYRILRATGQGRVCAHIEIIPAGELA